MDVSPDARIPLDAILELQDKFPNEFSFFLILNISNRIKGWARIESGQAYDLMGRM